MKRKHILCIIGQLGNGGTEKQLYLFLKHLDKGKYIPLVVVSSSLYIPKWKQRFEDELEVKVTSLAAYPACAKFAVFKFILWKYQPDLIFSWSFYTNPFISVAHNIPFIGSLRGGIEEERACLSRTHFKLALKPKKFIVNSMKLVDELFNENIKQDYIMLIKNIFEQQNFKQRTNNNVAIREKYMIPSDAVLISGGGRNSESKDFPLWLDTFENALKINSNIFGILFGHGPKTIIENEVCKRGLDDKIILTGDIPDVSAILKASNIFFLSSLYEGLPNVVLEAIDAGCALLSTDTAGIRDILEGVDKEILDSIILHNRIPEKAAAMLIALVTDKKLKERVAKEIHITLENFKPDKIMPKYYMVINSMIQE